MTHNEALEIVAKDRGFDSWSMLQAAYEDLKDKYGVIWLAEKMAEANTEAWELVDAYRNSPVLRDLKEILSPISESANGQSES